MGKKAAGFRSELVEAEKGRSPLLPLFSHFSFDSLCHTSSSYSLQGKLLCSLYTPLHILDQLSPLPPPRLLSLASERCYLPQPATARHGVHSPKNHRTPVPVWARLSSQSLT